jgi:hypothetical protein
MSFSCSFGSHALHSICALLIQVPGVLCRGWRVRSGRFTQKSVPAFFSLSFDDPYAKAGKPSERLVYKILNSRAIEIAEMEDGLHYSIGLAHNEKKGVTDVYSSTLIHKVLPNFLVIEVPPLHSKDAWYTCGVIDSGD